MGVMAKRSSMTFFSDGTSHYSHRVRIVLAEKGVTVDIVDANPDDMPEEVSELNPYNNLPTLLDRDLALYESKVMMEYLDERFPHPPLLPVYPVARGQCRLWMYRIERDWCSLVDVIIKGKDDSKVVEKARKDLCDSLLSIAPIFAEMPFFLSEEFTLVDCCLTPILWRLPSLGVQLPQTKQSKPLLDYMGRMFEMPSFQASLSDQETEMR
jgi:RNA polymerase-associated protein|tara:strand:+ start:2336 stop:2968 length:633 start_codon:yes stop_codon:yes gene_type:complete